MAVVPFPDIMLGTALQEFPVQVVCKAECTKQLHLGRSAAWPTLNKKADAHDRYNFSTSLAYLFFFSFLP